MLSHNPVSAVSKITTDESLSTLDGRELFLAELASNHSIQCLKLKNVRNTLIIDDFFKRFLDILSTHAGISEVIFDQCGLGDANAEELAKAVAKNKHIRAFSITNDKVTATGAEKIAEAFKENTSLLGLNLFGNQLYYPPIPIDEDITLTSSYTLPDDYINGVIAKLASIPHLEVLDLGKNELTQNHLALLIEGLSHNTIPLQELGLAYNSLQNSGLKQLFAGLKSNILLKSLDVTQAIRGRFKETNDAIGESISELLKSNNTLASLNLHNLGLESGVVPLSVGLAENTGLKELNLQYNEIQSEGFKALANTLSVNRTLIDLNISISHCSVEDIEVIFGSLKINGSLQRLGMTANSFCDDKTPADFKASLNFVLETLKQNRTLLSLYDPYSWCREPQFECPIKEVQALLKRNRLGEMPTDDVPEQKNDVVIQSPRSSYALMHEVLPFTSPVVPITSSDVLRIEETTPEVVPSVEPKLQMEEPETMADEKNINKHHSRPCVML